MSVPAAPHAGDVRNVGARPTPAFRALARAWRSLTWRHWLMAIGVGLLMGAENATFMFLYAIRRFLAGFPDLASSHVFLVMLTNRGLFMTGVACALAVALALLRDLSQRAAIRPRDLALTTLVVAAFGSLVIVPITSSVALALHSWLHLPGNASPFQGGAGWLTALSRTYSDTGEPIFTFVATVTLSAFYYLKGSRTSDALAIAQLGLSRAHKRRLTEELRTAQAALDPDFLFATLAEIDRRFGSEPHLAQRLLDALIRYLRAALPPRDEAIGTLGQQATLVRAYLEIENIRSSDRLQGDVDVPSELEGRLFAPALILPLVAVAAGDIAGSGREGRIDVGVSLASGKLTVEVRCDGGQPLATAEQELALASLRQRVSALYGSAAELFFATRAPRGITGRIVIDDPGNL
jgi:hypothetical protein